MYPPKEEWSRFADEDERAAHYKKWGLPAPTGRQPRPVIYCGPGVNQPVHCEVLGYIGSSGAVLDIAGELTCINGYYLAELQPEIPQKLLCGMSAGSFWQDYVVLDIETTGLNRLSDEIIELAAIRYSCGQEKERFHTFINPGRPLSHEIINLTGITQEDVDPAPKFDDIAGGFLSFIGTSPLLGHNASSFDVPFLSYHLRVELENPVADTLFIARRTFPDLPSYKLEHLKYIFHLNDNISHQALADVETTHALLLACMTPWKYASQVAAANWCLRDHGISVRAKKQKQAMRVQAGEESAQPFQQPGKGSAFRRISVKEIKPNCRVDQDHPLCGKTVVFTGELSIPREEAMQMVVNAGATVKTAVSKKTNYLVVGTQDKTLVGDDGMSTKEEKAYAINESGKARIEILKEEDFFTLVGGNQNE